MATCVTILLVISASPAYAGTFTPDPDSPLLGGIGSTNPNTYGVAFTADGRFLASADNNHVAYDPPVADNTISLFEIQNGGVITEAANSPYTTGSGPNAVAFQPTTSPTPFLAVANDSASTVTMYKLNESQATLTEVDTYLIPGLTPETGGPVDVAFSPNGDYLAVANGSQGGVEILDVSSTGQLTADTSTDQGDAAYSVAFSPLGDLLAYTGNQSSDFRLFSFTPGASPELSQVANTTISPNGVQVLGWGPATSSAPEGELMVSTGKGGLEYAVGTGGTLTENANSPYAIGNNPTGIAFDPLGGYFASVDNEGNLLRVFSVAANGDLSAISGSPIADPPASTGGTTTTGTGTTTTGTGTTTTGTGTTTTGTGTTTTGTGTTTKVTGSPLGVAYSPTGGLIASANQNGGGSGGASINVYTAPGPSATISSPTAVNPTYAEGTDVPTTYSCSDPVPAPGIASCVDNNPGVYVTEGSGSGQLNTSSPGIQDYTVTATSQDGQVSIATFYYYVAPPTTLTLTEAAGSSSASACPSNPSATGTLQVGLCGVLNLTAGTNGGTPPTGGTLSLDVNGTTQSQSFANSQPATAPFGITPTANATFLTARFTSADSHYANAFQYDQIPGLALVTVNGSSAPGCGGHPTASAPAVGDCLDEQLTVSPYAANEEAANWSGVESVTVTYQPAGGGAAQTTAAQSLAPGDTPSTQTFNFAITPTATAGTVTATFSGGTDPSDQWLNDSVAAPLSANAGGQPTITVTPAAGHGTSLCASSPTGSTTAAAYVAARCSIAAVTLAPSSGAPFDPGHDSVTLSYTNAGGTTVSSTQTLPAGDTSGSAAIPFAVTPGASTSSLQVSYSSANTANYLNSSASVAIIPAPTPSPALTITTVAGQGQTGCAGQTATASAEVVQGECSAVLVQATDPSGDAGRPFGADDVVQATYQVPGGTPVALAPAALNLNGQAVITFTAPTVSSSAYTLATSATSTSSDGAYGSGSGSASLSAQPSGCYAVSAPSATTETRAAGVPVIATVQTLVTAVSGACSLPAPGVTFGGQVRLQAIAPAYEEITGWTATTSGSSTTVPTSQTPQAGQGQSATLTVDGPTTVTPIFKEVDPVCPQLTLDSRWKGLTSDETDLGNFTVSGPIGCSVNPSSTGQTATPGQSITVFPGTPLTVTANSAQMTATIGEDTLADFTGTPSSSQVTANQVAFSVGTSSATVTAEMQMLCTQAPLVVQSTGGTVTAGTPGNFFTVGALSHVLTSKSVTVGRNPDPVTEYEPECPADWGGGLLPGTDLQFAAEADKSGDFYPGVTSTDAYNQWSVPSSSFQTEKAVSDPSAAQASTVKSELASQITPELLGAPPANLVANGVGTYVEPAANGTSSAPAHVVAVGFQFARVGCVPVSTSTSGDDGGTGVYSTTDSATHTTYSSGGSVDTTPTGAVTLSPAPNCGKLGGDYYQPGTVITATATDPRDLGSETAATPFLHSGGYDGTTHSEYFETSTTATASRIPSVRRTEAGPGGLTGSVRAHRTAPLKKPTPGHGKTGTKTKRPKPVTAPVAKPTRVPLAAGRVPSVAATRNAAAQTIGLGSSAITRANRRAATRGSAERTAARALAHAQRTATPTRISTADRVWTRALAAWWAQRAAGLTATVDLARAQLTQLTQLTKSTFASGGHPLDTAATAITESLIHLRVAEALLSADRARLARLRAVHAATQRAATSRPRVLVLGSEATRLATAANDARASLVSDEDDLDQGRQTLASLRTAASAADRAAAQRTATELERPSRLTTRTVLPKRLRAILRKQRATLAKGAAARRQRHSHIEHAGPVARMASANRALFPDESNLTYSFQYPQGNVTTPVTYQGMWAGPSNPAALPSGLTASELTQVAPAGATAGSTHTGTFRVGGVPMVIAANWGPSTCDTPAIHPYDSSQFVSVTINGGLGQCAGPGTVSRLGTFEVQATPSLTAIPVISVTGYANGSSNGALGQLVTNVGVGDSALFPDLYDSQVTVQACEPLEFGGQVTDTVGGGTLPFDASAIDEFASVVPGTGSECAVPGFYTVGSKVRFSVPSQLAPALVTRTVTNLALAETYDDDGTGHPVAVPTSAPGSAGDCEGLYIVDVEDGPEPTGVCQQQIGPSGTADWLVDGSDVGASPPTVTLSGSQPQHTVAFNMTVQCDRMSLTVHSFGEQTPAFPSSDCPVPYPDETTADTADDGGNSINYTYTGVGYYLSGENPSFSLPVCEQGIGSSSYNTVDGMEAPQPLDGGQFSSGAIPDGSQIAGDNDTDGQAGLDQHFNAKAGADAINTFVPNFSATRTDANISVSWCGGDTDTVGNDSGLTNYGPGSLGDVLFNIPGVVPFLNNDVVPVVDAFLQNLKTAFTTNPFKSVESLTTFAQSFGLSVGAVALAAVDPPSAALLLEGASNPAALSSPQNFGEFLAGAAVQRVFGLAEEDLIGSESILGDSVLTQLDGLLISGLQSVGTPSALTDVLRGARVVLNGDQALQTCSSDAAAGTEPPSAISNITPVNSGVTLVQVLKTAYDKYDPVPLVKTYVPLFGDGTVTPLNAYESAAKEDSSEGSAGEALTNLVYAHDFAGSNVAWSASDFADCLADNTFG